MSSLSVDEAYEACEQSTRDASATFYFATLLMGAEERRKTWAIYTWCRVLDETVDSVEALEVSPCRLTSGQPRLLKSLPCVCNCLKVHTAALSINEEE